ncbi:MAG: flagellar biosynthesis protein FlhA [Deltaproteobacteria bacterium]|nr:flagellar biosynthesis protein FlhA [Deltaproteobacteria bacterium]
MKNPSPLLDLLAALGVLFVVGSLLIPLPLLLLDLLLTLNLGLALLLLATALLLHDPLRLSSFPTLLLISTLFRLALNVSSTRQILGRGEAGQIIEAFGAFVVGGSHIVGAVVFAILTVVQLVVVARGAERVAEVGARFTLDGLPGKQLSIDADLRSGGCSQAEGARRRAQLEEESRFYGALDGAMKFVKGDAIAGLLITLINVVGGLAVGVGIHGLSPGEAAAHFTLLSIGDGLVSQLPALLASVAAGVVVTRVARQGGEGGSAGELVRQLVDDPRALALAATVLVVLGLVPGLPLLPFLLSSLTLGAAARFAYRRKDRDRELDPDGELPEPRAAAPGSAPPPGAVLPASPRAAASRALVLELGDTAAGDHEALPGELRRALQARLGLAPPPLLLREGAAGRYRLLLHGALLAEGVLPERAVLPLRRDEARLLGIDGREIEHRGQAALELEAGAEALARRCGLHPLTPDRLLVSALQSALADSAGEWLTLQHTAALIDHLEGEAPSLVEEVRARLGPSLLHRVLQLLLEEGVPLRPLDRLLEALLLVEPERLLGEGIEVARRALGRQLVQPLLEAGALPCLLLDPLTDARLRGALARLEDAPVLALDPEEQTALREGVERLAGARPVALLAPEELRSALSRLLRARPAGGPRIEVLAYGELPAELPLRPLGRLELPSGSRAQLDPFEGVALLDPGGRIDQSPGWPGSSLIAPAPAA